jgi:hypothetical protein
VISVLLPHPPQSSNSSNYAFTRKTWIVGQILSFQASNKRVCKIVLSGNKLSKAREQLICDTWKSLQFSLSLSLSLSLACVFALLLHGALEKKPLQWNTTFARGFEPATGAETAYQFDLPAN